MGTAQAINNVVLFGVGRGNAGSNKVLGFSQVDRERLLKVAYSQASPTSLKPALPNHERNMNERGDHFLSAVAAGCGVGPSSGASNCSSDLASSEAIHAIRWWLLASNGLLIFSSADSPSSMGSACRNWAA